MQNNSFCEYRASNGFFFKNKIFDANIEVDTDR